MEQSIVIYNQFLDEIKGLNHDISSYTDNPEKRLERFYMVLDKDDLFYLFSMAKIKVFSAKTVETHEVSVSLFGESLTLKHIFNNQTDDVKNTLWVLLFNLYIQLEKHYNSHSNRIQVLKENMKKLRNETFDKEKAEKFKNMLNKDVNPSTSNMLEEIIGSFQDVISNKGNPFDNIMGITEKITSKYGKMIEKGEIEIDKILSGMTNVIGSSVNEVAKEAEAPVIIDDNFSTSNVEVGKEEEEEESGGFNLKSLSKFMPLTNIMNKLGSIKTPDDIASIKNEMDSFMKTELNMDMSQYTDQINEMQQRLSNMNYSNVEDANGDLNTKMDDVD